MKILYKIITVLFLCSLVGCSKKEVPQVFVASTTPTIQFVSSDESEMTFTRGDKVYLEGETDDHEFFNIYVLDENENKIKFSVPKENISETLDGVVLEKEITCKMLLNLRKDRDSDITDVVAKKGETLKIVGCNMDRDFNEDGTCDGYMVEKDGETYYFDVFYAQDEIPNKDKIHYGDYFDMWYYDGYSKEQYIDTLEFFPVEKTDYPTHPFKKDVNAVHVGLTVGYEEQDYLISLCKETGINSIVMEIKCDDGRLIFESVTAKEYLPDRSYAEITAISKDEFKKVIDRYKAEGIYLIGRVVTMKDPVFTKAYPDEAIINSDGSLYEGDGENWPTPYSRLNWRYVLSYAKEAASLGIDEIQFDYIRFPDGIADLEEEGAIDLRNKYGETKTQAITHFLYYAREELAKSETYLSCDVFGWNMICGDDENIGQFIPAMANVVDAISPMPYPDHFGAGSLDLAQPWQEPYLLLKNFTEKSTAILNTIPNPATFRSWIQGYSCLEWVCEGTPDNPENDYGPDAMEAQIQGIRDGGQDGYIVWSGDGGASMFEWRKYGFIE